MICLAEGINWRKRFGTIGSGEQTYNRSCEENLEQNPFLFSWFTPH